jgi:N-acyl-D-amino-acid deacylase
MIVNRTKPRFSPPSFVAMAGLFLLTAAVILLIARRGGAIHDVVISNALIVDGTGAPPFMGGIGVDGDRITEIWHGRQILGRRARLREIDAGGKVLAPGFIDTHSHADLSIGEGSSPIRAHNFTYQGVTTLIVGNCGRSPFRPGELAAIVELRGIDVNLAALSGLNSVRERVMKQSTEPASPTEIESLAALVREDMEDGALGVSTGYAYVPGRFASRAEIAAQLVVAASYGGVHTTHMRDEGREILHSVDEVLAVSRDASVPLLISHLKITGPANCHLYPALLQTFHRFSKANGVLYFDQYPYDASSTSLDLLLPDWFLHLSEREQTQLLVTQPKRLEEAISLYLRKEAFRDLGFAHVSSYAPQHAWQGLTIPEVDRRFFGHSPSTLATQIAVVVEMLRHGGAQMVYQNICPSVMASIPRDLPSMIGSDSAIRYDDGTTLPHPRGWGTFPRALHEYVRVRHLLALETMVRRMTDLPARFFGLERRGRIALGYYADLVVFDPDRVADRALFNAPFQRPEGIADVFVNGQPVIETHISPGSRGNASTVPTSATPGRFLKRPRRIVRMADGLVSAPRVSAPYQTAQVTFLGRLFGADPSAPLQADHQRARPQ